MQVPWSRRYLKIVSSRKRYFKPSLANVPHLFDILMLWVPSAASIDSSNFFQLYRNKKWPQSVEPCDIWYYIGLRDEIRRFFSSKWTIFHILTIFDHHLKPNDRPLSIVQIMSVQFDESFSVSMNNSTKSFNVIFEEK